MTRLRIVSDGRNHRIETESGEQVRNVVSVTIGKIVGGGVVTATVEIVNVPIDVIAEIPDKHG